MDREVDDDRQEQLQGRERDQEEEGEGEGAVGPQQPVERQVEAGEDREGGEGAGVEGLAEARVVE